MTVRNPSAISASSRRPALPSTTTAKRVASSRAKTSPPRPRIAGSAAGPRGAWRRSGDLWTRGLGRELGAPGREQIARGRERRDRGERVLEHHLDVLGRETGYCVARDHDLIARVHRVEGEVL